MNIRTIIGIVAGMLVGWGLALSPAFAQEQKPTQHDIAGQGYTVDCYGNGKGGKRVCDIDVLTPSTVKNFTINQYRNGEFEIGLTTWGYNGGGNGDKYDGGNGGNGQTVGDLVQSRVVR